MNFPVLCLGECSLNKNMFSWGLTHTSRSPCMFFKFTPKICVKDNIVFHPFLSHSANSQRNKHPYPTDMRNTFGAEISRGNRIKLYIKGLLFFFLPPFFLTSSKNSLDDIKTVFFKFLDHVFQYDTLLYVL